MSVEVQKMKNGSQSRGVMPDKTQREVTFRSCLYDVLHFLWRCMGQAELFVHQHRQVHDLQPILTFA